MPPPYPLFIETPGFTRRWEKLGLADRDMIELEKVIEAGDPGDVIVNTGGFRKMRFAPPSQAGGKSGGVRVIDLTIPKYSVVVLGVVYAKVEKATLSAGDKKALRTLATEYERELEMFFTRGN